MGHVPERWLPLPLLCAVALFLGTANAHAATTTTVTVTSGQTIVSGLNAGDKVDIVATLSTNDPDENGEGEPLVLSSTGGFSASVPNYAQPTAFSFTASTDGESLSGSIAGYDGDETATVTVTVNSKAKKRFTQAQKDALAKAAADLNIWAAGGATVTAICAVLPPPADLCVAFFGPFSGVTWIGSALYGRLALDPSDPDYTDIAQPSTASLDLMTLGPGKTQAEVDAFNALIGNEELAAAYAEAAYVTVNRAQGAADAGSDDWEAKQVAALNGYTAHLGALLEAQPALLNAFADALQAGGITRTITPNDVFNFEFQVVFGTGLPQSVLDTLRTLGVDQQAFEQIQELAFVQNIFDVAGDYPAMLRNQSFQADLRAAGTALGSVADTSPPTTTASLDGPTGKNGWYTGAVKVTLSATDPDGAADVASTHYSVDGGAAQTYAAPFSVSGDGTHVVSYWSVDQAGNEETHRSTTIAIDGTAPVVSVTATPAQLWPPNGKLVDVTVSGSATDAGSGLDSSSAAFSVADEYGAVQPSGPLAVAADGSYSVHVSLEARRDGSDLDGRKYAVTVTASDLAGNVGTASFVVLVPHDQR
jgi:hypothetical protein